MHDPLCVFYMLTRNSPSWNFAPRAPEDIRIETAGQWTRGMHVIDRRNRKKVGGGTTEQVKSPGAVDISNPMESLSLGAGVTDGVQDQEAKEEQADGDEYGWLHVNKGNRINRVVGTPGEDMFGPYLVARVFGQLQQQA